ncbi:MAG: endonuclease/exonuclease/phosphatase family protein [Patescibacteria group bacterium]
MMRVRFLPGGQIPACIFSEPFFIMKLISLNTWGGRIFEPLIKFIRSASVDTDIFCFQEMFTYQEAQTSNNTRLNLFSEIKNILSGHAAFFEPIQDYTDVEGVSGVPSTFGQAIFIRNSFAVEKTGFLFTYRSLNAREGGDIDTMGVGFQYLQFARNKKRFAILSLHGISRPGDKLDTPDRIKQSERIVHFLEGINVPKILCGDFNLMPKTRSIQMIEEAGLTNLITAFNIQETRGKLSPFYGKPDYQKFADYAFVSKDVLVHSFAVPDSGISDHLPMILEFS